MWLVVTDQARAADPPPLFTRTCPLHTRRYFDTDNTVRTHADVNLCLDVGPPVTVKACDATAPTNGTKQKWTVLANPPSPPPQPPPPTPPPPLAPPSPPRYPEGQLLPMGMDDATWQVGACTLSRSCALSRDGRTHHGCEPNISQRAPFSCPGRQTRAPRVTWPWASFSTMSRRCFGTHAQWAGTVCNRPCTYSEC